MTFLEIFLITLFSIFQSIFGIGILILGTPTFLILGYNYFEILNILLPYSITISFLQIITSKSKDFTFLYDFFLYSIPTLLIGLLFAKYIQSNFNLKIVIAIFLIISSLINLIEFNLKITNLFKLISLGLLGFIQGISNLGGALLSLIANNLSIEKNLIRFYISTGYLFFAIFQLIFTNIFVDKINLSKLEYLWLPIISYLLANIFFKYIQNRIYSLCINILILIYGVYLLI